jgi:dual specificity tyrosine-phosphorylation-regulated kinase 2/3/4
MKDLTDYEKGEILDFNHIYFVGKRKDVKKIKGNPLYPYNFGYDDDQGDYKVVMGDHVGYRYEVLSFLGKGSFG